MSRRLYLFSYGHTSPQQVRVRIWPRRISKLWGAYCTHKTCSSVVKCRECGKEFIHEKDRLHHVREEHEQKLDYRTHKDSYKTKKIGPPQDQVDVSTKSFGDNF